MSTARARRPNTPSLSADDRELWKRRLPAAILMIAASLIGCAGAPPPLDGYPHRDSRTTEIDGITVHYLDFNPDATGGTLVWVHGQSGAALETWYLMDHLGKDYRLIAIDMPGAGLSEKPKMRYTAELYQQVLTLFLEELALERYVLVGHSMGAVTVTSVAAHAPVGLEKLILVAPYFFPGQPGGFLELMSNTGFLVNIAMQLYAPWMLRAIVSGNAFYDSSRVPEELLNTYLTAVFHTPNGRGALASVTRRIVGKRRDPALLESLRIPTLILWGREDRVLSYRYAERFPQTIPTSRLVTIENCGHVPHVERPGVVAKEIRQFIESRW